MTKKNLIIFGTGSFAEIATEYFNKYSDYIIVGYCCDSDNKKKETFLEKKVYIFEEILKKNTFKECYFFVAIGYSKSNAIREKFYLHLKKENKKTASFIHPSVDTWKTNTLGEHLFILENNIIQPYVSIEDNTILWSGNHIGHHTKIGKNNFISSQVVISGHCDIGDNCFFGVNSTIFDQTKISNFSTIGAGSLIKKNTQINDVYAKSPTKKLKNISSSKN